MFPNTGVWVCISVDNINFPFQYDEFPEFGRLFVPIVKIGLNTMDGLVHYNFIVDTGADFTTLPHHMAYRLGLDLKKTKLWILRNMAIFYPAPF